MDIAEHLKQLELELMQDATRKNPARVASLLADDFREFGSSGRVYSKDDMIGTLQAERPVTISASEFAVSLLSDTVALVTYVSQTEQLNDPPARALRSSIWIQVDGGWRMAFHQGTKLA